MLVGSLYPSPFPPPKTLMSSVSGTSHNPAWVCFLTTDLGSFVTNFLGSLPLSLSLAMSLRGVCVFVCRVHRSVSNQAMP